MWDWEKVRECKLLILALTNTRALDLFFFRISIGCHHAAAILLLSENLHILPHVPLVLSDHSFATGEPINDHSLKLKVLPACLTIDYGSLAKARTLWQVKVTLADTRTDKLGCLSGQGDLLGFRGIEGQDVEVETILWGSLLLESQILRVVPHLRSEQLKVCQDESPLLW